MGITFTVLNVQLLSPHSFIEIITIFFCFLFFPLFCFLRLEWQWQNDSTDDDESKVHGQNSCWVPYPVTERSIFVTGKRAQLLTFLLEKWKVFASVPFPLPASSILTLCSAPQLNLRCRMTEETLRCWTWEQQTQPLFLREKGGGGIEGEGWGGMCSPETKDPLTLCMAIRADTTSYPCTLTSPERRKK